MGKSHRAHASVILKLGFQGGITEEQMLKFMGANTRLNSLQAKELLEVSLAFPHLCILWLSKYMLEDIIPI